MAEKYLNAIGTAVELAKSDKYKENITIQALLTNFNTALIILNSSSGIIEGYDPLAGYLKGVNGTEGYSTSGLDRGTIDYMVTTNIKRMLHLAEAQAKAESLIIVLQVYGEKIDF